MKKILIMTIKDAISEIENFMRYQMGTYLYRFEFMEDELSQSFDYRFSSRFNDDYSLIEYSNGYYLGNVIEGQKGGFGVYVWKNYSSIDSIYMGEWWNDKREGLAFSLHDTFCYHGEFLDGKYHGKGHYINSKGLDFEAYFDNGNISRLICSNYDFTFNGRNFSAR